MLPDFKQLILEVKEKGPEAERLANDTVAEAERPVKE